MKPLNYNERKSRFLRFALIAFAAVFLTGFTVWTTAITSKVQGNNSLQIQGEITDYKEFISKADELLGLYEKAESDTDRNKYNLDINALIKSNEGSFESSQLIFDKMSELYKSLMRKKETIVNLSDEASKECDERIKELENEITDLQKEVESGKDDKKDLKRSKAAIQRVATELGTIANAIEKSDWCKGLTGGSGRDGLKKEFKDSLNSLKNDLIEQISSMN